MAGGWPAGGGGGPNPRPRAGRLDRPPRSERMKRRLLRLGVLLLVAGGLGAWWFDAPARLGWAPEPESRPTPYGNVDIRQVELGFRVSGRVAERGFEEGDRGEAGTGVARLV